MSGKKNILILVTGAAMDLCWLYAWAAFLAISLYDRFWPFALTVWIYALAAGAAVMKRRKIRRRIIVILLQLLFFSLGFIIVLHRFSTQAFNLWNVAWILAWLKAMSEPTRWFLLAFLLILTVVIWKRGLTFITRPLTTENVYNRFDLGIAAFFVLLIVKTLLSVRGWVTISHPETTLLYFPFLIFSLLTIGSIRNSRNGRKDYISGFQKIGVVLSFSTVILLTGACLMVLFYSELTTGAEILSQGLKKTTAPMVPVLKTILRFLLMHNRQTVEDKPLLFTDDLNTSGISSGGQEPSGILSEIIKWLPTGLILVVFLSVVCLGAFLLFKALFSKTNSEAENEAGHLFLVVWLRNLKKMLVFCLKTVRRWIKGYDSGIELYTSLLAWGRHSGLPRRQVETPLEYQCRIGRHFPKLVREIGLIIALFNRETYRETVLNSKEITSGQQALKKLKSITNLPLRMKTWIFSNGI